MQIGERYDVLIDVLFLVDDTRAVDEYVVEEEEIALLGLLATLFDEYAFANECAARYGKRFLVVAAKAALDEADAFRVYFRLGYCNINKILLN